MSHPSEMASRGKICLVTGATRGIGLATAAALARRGAHVVLTGRSAERLAAAARQIGAQPGAKQPDMLLADFSSLSQVRALAAEFQQRYDRLDVLVNNAGGTFLKYQAAADGLEWTWTVNYLSQYLLTRSLMELLKEAARRNGEARVVGVSSNIYRLSKPVFTPGMDERNFNGVMAYARSKRAINTFSCDMARRMAGSGVSFNAITPGFVATGVASNNHGWASRLMRLMNRFATPVEKGIMPIVHLCAAPEMRGISGQYFVKFQQRAPDASFCDPSVTETLWRISSAQAGLPE